MRAAVRPCKETTAFLLCDVQERFRTLVSRPEKIIRTASKMIEASQILRIPLIVTEQNPDKLGRTVPELDISKANLLDAKMKFSMYTPSVASFFQHNQNLKSVVLFGIEAHVCVYQTALDFLGQNYQVFLVSDGISAQDEAEIPVALEQLRTFGAVVSSSDSLLFQLLGGATHPDFKAVSSLVKTHSSSKL